MRILLLLKSVVNDNDKSSLFTGFSANQISSMISYLSAPPALNPSRIPIESQPPYNIAPNQGSYSNYDPSRNYINAPIRRPVYGFVPGSQISSYYNAPNPSAGYGNVPSQASGYNIARGQNSFYNIAPSQSFDYNIAPQRSPFDILDPVTRHVAYKF